MRMRIGVAGQTVRGPAGMTNAQRAGDRFFRDELLEARHAADALSDLEFPVMYKAHSRGIIPAILESPQALDQEWRSRGLADVSNDAAHLRGLFQNSANHNL